MVFAPAQVSHRGRNWLSQLQPNCLKTDSIASDRQYGALAALRQAAVHELYRPWVSGRIVLLPASQASLMISICLHPHSAHSPAAGLS